MPKDTDLSFVKEKNKDQNEPIWLYRVAIDDNINNDLFVAESDENINYYKDVNTPQIYTAIPIQHDNITENTKGQIDTVNISWGNASSEIIAFVENYNGLRGCKVTSRQVFRKHLADSEEPNYNAYLEYIFYIDSCIINNQDVTFSLTSGLDVLETQLPKFTYSRDRCQFPYKGYGCWLIDENIFKSPIGFIEPTGLVTCNKTMDECEQHYNLKRFGGFPGIPLERML